MDQTKYPLPPEEPRAREFVYTEHDPVRVIGNDRLQCAGCIHALSQTGVCKKYRPKPDYVLLNRGPCPGFEAAQPEPPSAPSEERCTVTHTPQCVGCVHNLGGFDCAMFVRKPEELLMNQKDCPARRPADREP